MFRLNKMKENIKHVNPMVLFVGAYRRINPCGSLASDDIKLNMIWMEKVKICNK